MLRIGLISDDLTFQEIRQSIDPNECEIKRSFEPHSVDSILVLAGDDKTDIVLERLMDDQGLAATDAPMIGTIGPSPAFRRYSGKVVNASNIEGFLKLSRMVKRRRTVVEESQLRESTISELINTPATKQVPETGKTRIVFLGEPSGFFLTLKRDLTDLGFDVVAALSERTAYDALTSSNTAGFVLSLPPEFYPMELLDHIHGRTDLKTMPVVLIAKEDWEVESIADYVSAYVHQSDAVADCTKHLVSLFQDQSHFMQNLSVANHPLVRDPATGAFNQTFAKRYLPNQLKAASKRSGSFQIAVVEPIYANSCQPIEPKDLAKFYARLSSMIRSEDFLAYVGKNQFLLSLPGMNESQTQTTLDRTRRILDATSEGSTGNTISFMFQIKSFAQSSALQAFMDDLTHQSRVA